MEVKRGELQLLVPPEDWVGARIGNVASPGGVGKVDVRTARSSTAGAAPPNEKPTRLQFLADGSVPLDTWLNECYSTIPFAPDGFVPLQQQHIIRPVCQQSIMV
jgi:hypothetical protein